MFVQNLNYYIFAILKSAGVINKIIENYLVPT